MILLHLDFLFALLYAAVFLFMIFRAGMLQWFWASIVLWLGISVLGAKLMPGMWGLAHAAPLFIPHFYLTLGSIFFFIGHWRRKADGGGWQADAGHPLLGLFAVSNVLMTFAFAGVCVLAYYWFSGTAQVFVFSALLKLYVLKPVYWFVLQFVLIAVAYVHGRGIDGRPSFLFSGSQLRLGMLTAALMQVSVLVLLLSEIGR
ncbi:MULTISPECIES: hypothetical protein [Neisseria]|uniref:hypothetical protein n=1 Tax=Neisseria TaxID=482 RepID=UPI00166140FA|nr:MULTISPECIES: hypothetical protein [Neisseria]MBD0763988.1 hypothetical protein [Neisseria sp. RH3002v2f]